MKRNDLIKLLEKNGCWLKRHGANHDIYTNGEKSQPVPRHSEIDKRLAKKIIKELGL